MRVSKWRVWLAAATIVSETCLAADDVQVADVVVDPPTVCCLGVSVPVSGDDNFNAVGTLEFRQVGSAAWSIGLPLLRVRPSLTSGETPPGTYGLPVPDAQFAGSILHLSPATSYEIRVAINDPDGGDRVQTVIVSTRGLPNSTPETPAIIRVTTAAELDAAIAAAQPGHIIELAAGRYNGSITVSADGTEANPIVIRGIDAEMVTIDAAGSTYGVSLLGEHIHLEHVTVSGSTWGARSWDTVGTVIQHSRFVDVNRGISATSGSNRSFYICDNVLQGQHAWPDVSSNTWDDEGIVITGQGHTVCFNTVSGFGDSLGLGNNTAIPNTAIDFFGNDVLWTGDDGLELDFAHRNVRAFANRITNANMGASLQPVWGGPVYILRNVFANIAASPYKLNNDPNGFFIYHNTSVRTLGPGNWGGYAWTSLGYTQSDGDQAYAANFAMKNNIFVGLSDPAYVTTDLILAEVDNNGWFPDGAFRFVDTWVNFADLQSNSPYEQNGRILAGSDFAVPITLPNDYTTFWSPPDVSLALSSIAIDAAEPLPNIADEFLGSAPDLGAIEFGGSQPNYGARTGAITIDTLPPSPPQNVSVQ